MGNYQAGVYKPSYINLRINSPVDFSHLKKLKRKVKAVYFHEYTHFLQDISTTFGLSNMWNTYDRIRQIVSKAQKSDGDLNIPFKRTEIENEFEKFNALKAIKGDYHIKEPFIDKGDFIVKRVSLRSNPHLEKLLADEQVRDVHLELENSNEQSYEYIFGAEAVSESMAYLMEQKLYKGTETELYPYCSAQKLADFVSKRISENKEFLFAVCDIAMMSAFPGLHFYIILLEIELKDFFPNTSRDIYDFAFDVLWQRGWNLLEEFKRNKEGLLHVFNEIFYREEFTDTREWFNYVVDAAFKIRMTNLDYPVQLYRNEPFGVVWENVVARVGFPEMHNSKSQRWFSAPLELKAKESSIHPIFLLAFWQIHDLLLMGKTECNLIASCKESNQRKMVDENCKTSPWKKVEGPKFCSFCALWVSFGLHEKNIDIKK